MVERIKELCDKTGTSIRGLERAIGAGGGTISRWDEHIPSITNVVAVADYFGISVDDLLGRDVPSRTLSRDQESLLELTDSLNADGVQMVFEIAKGIALQNKYKKRNKMDRDKKYNDEIINEA